MRPKDLRPGIYLLPNLLTTASLFAAFYAIVAAMKGQYETAVMAIYLGMLADTLDGRVARLTNTQTAFGAEYDSLSDMVTFGVAPSLLAYSAYLHQFGKFGWLVSFIYTASVALRLARFNTQLETADKRYFQGLPCPPAAAIVAAFVWMMQPTLHQVSAPWKMGLLAGLMVLIGILMVSNIRYYSFKQMDSKDKIPFLYLLLIVFLFVAVAMNPAMVLFITFLAFALSGPTQTLFQLHRVRHLRRRYRRK